MRSFSAGFEYDQSMYVRAFVTQVHGRFIVKVGRMTSSGATAAFTNPSVSKRAVAAVRAKASNSSTRKNAPSTWPKYAVKFVAFRNS